MDRTAVVLATKDRPELAAKVVWRLLDQTQVPSLIAVVDASDTERHQLLASLLPRTPSVRLVRSIRASQPHQKNAGVQLALEDDSVGYVQFLDDDVEFEEGYLASSAEILRSRQDLGGVCGATDPAKSSSMPRWRRAYLRFFRLLPGGPGTVTSAGRNAGVFWDPTDLRPVKTQWLLGCAMYRREVLTEKRFWDDQEGYVLFEDVEFSTRVGRDWGLAALPWLRLEHLELSRDEVNHARTGYQMVVNRSRVVDNLPHASKVEFWTGVVGSLLHDGLSGLMGSSAARQRFMGGLRGVRELLGRSRRSSA